MRKRLVVVVEDSRMVHSVKRLLDQKGVLDKAHKVTKISPLDDDDDSDNEFGKYQMVTTLAPPQRETLESIIGDLRIDEREIETNPDTMSIQSIVETFLEDHGLGSKLMSVQWVLAQQRIPKRWSSYPPLLLCPPKTFESDVWVSLLGDLKLTFFEHLLRTKFPHHTHIAVNNPIVREDVMRRPFDLIPVFGSFGPELSEARYDSPTEDDFETEFWCHCVQNGIYQTWAPRFTMFSRGNIKEKARILKTFKNIDGRVIMDLYAGIGYFTLCYLKRGAAKVFAWEINPWSVRGLEKNAKANKIPYKVIHQNEELSELDDNIRLYIFQESNEYAIERLSKLYSQAVPLTHINMGLLPTSKPSWEIAMIAVSRFNPEGSTMLHIHENIHDDDLESFRNATPGDLEILCPGMKVEHVHLEKIKTYARNVWHVCDDVRVFKQN